jgi:hypothetical protein
LKEGEGEGEEEGEELKRVIQRRSELSGFMGLKVVFEW